MSLRWPALAAVSSYAIYWLWPEGDALASTLVLLPWAMLIWRFALERLEEEIARPLGAGLLVSFAMLALVAVAPWRHRLPWAGVDRLWIAGFLLLTAIALWRLVPALYRRLRRRQNPGWVFFLLPLAFYLAIQPWSLGQRQPDGDEPYYLLLSHSLAFDGDTDLANNYEARDWQRFMRREIEAQPGDPVGDGGEIYSRHSALLPMLLAPAYRLAGRPGATAMIAAMTAWVAWLMLSLARRWWPESPGGALFAWLLLAWTPPLVLYSHQVWIEVPAALLTLLALDCLERLHRRAAVARGEISSKSDREETAGRRVADLVGLALALALLPMLKMRLLLVAAPLALLALALVGRRVAGVFAGGLAAAIALLLAYNQWRFDNPLRMYSSSELDLLLSPPADWLRGAAGMFLDTSFGLFATAPVWWLILAGFVELVRRRDRYAIVLVFLTAPYLAALAPRLEWYGGWSPPFRYPLVFLPLLALAVVPLLERRPAGTRVLGGALSSVTLAFGLLFLAVPGWTYNLADGASHLLHQASLLWQADIARLFPSTIRPRAATWIWIVACLALVPFALLDAQRIRQRVASVATLLLLLAGAAVPAMAKHLPTRVVEPEDAWVTKHGGRLFPDRWTPQRPSRRGAWRMSSWAVLEAPVVTGGPRARVRVHVRRDTIGPQVLEVSAGEQLIGTIDLPRRSEWRVYEMGPAEWPEDAPLVIFSPQVAKRKELGLLIDRVEIEWLD